MGLLGFVDTVQDGEDLKTNKSSRDALLWLLGPPEPEPQQQVMGRPSVTSGASAGNYPTEAGN